MKPKEAYQMTEKGMEHKAKYYPKRKGTETKYVRGYPITSMDHLSNLCLKEGKYVYLRDRLIHPKWVANMTYNVVHGFMKGGFFHEAEKRHKNG